MVIRLCEGIDSVCAGVAVNGSTNRYTFDMVPRLHRGMGLLASNLVTFNAQTGFQKTPTQIDAT